MLVELHNGNVNIRFHRRGSSRCGTQMDRAKCGQPTKRCSFSPSWTLKKGDLRTRHKWMVTGEDETEEENSLYFFVGYNDGSFESKNKRPKLFIVIRHCAFRCTDVALCRSLDHPPVRPTVCRVDFRTDRPTECSDFRFRDVQLIDTIIMRGLVIDQFG